MVEGRLHVEGVRELNKLLRAVGGRELQKELGQVHKSIGQMVIDQLGGAKTGVGEGAGSTVRASAATREVQLRVGGSHRAADGPIRPEQWGKREVWPGGLPPARPHLIGAAAAIEDRIEDAYLDGVDAIIRRVGLT